jgi:hypothetical protein
LALRVALPKTILQLVMLMRHEQGQRIDNHKNSIRGMNPSLSAKSKNAEPIGSAFFFFGRV